MNPRPGSWESLIPTITNNLDGEKKIEPVSFSTWLEALKESASEKTEDVSNNPAIKLLDWFQGMQNHAGEATAELETVQTEKRSETLRELPAVGPEWMEIWLKQWRF